MQASFDFFYFIRDLSFRVFDERLLFFFLASCWFRASHFMGFRNSVPKRKTLSPAPLNLG